MQGFKVYGMMRKLKNYLKFNNMSEQLIISQTNYQKGTRIVDVYLDDLTIDVQKYNVYVYRFKELSEKFRQVSYEKVNEILENN